MEWAERVEGSFWVEVDCAVERLLEGKEEREASRERVALLVVVPVELVLVRIGRTVAMLA